MICPNCHGTGGVPTVIARSAGAIVAVEERPCPDCGGGGIAHCCDGLRAQPEPAPPPCAREEQDP